MSADVEGATEDGPGRLARVHIHLDHGRSPQSWTVAHRARAVFEPSPYCYAEAAAYADLTFSSDRDEGRLIRTLRRGLKRLAGFDVIHAWRDRHQLRAAEVIWTHTEREHLAVSLLMRLRLVPTIPMIGQSVWLWDEWEHFSRMRRQLLKRLLECVTLHTTLSSENARHAAAVLDREVLFVPFGCSGLAQLPVAERSPGTIRAIAPGNDKHRDWGVLAALVGSTADIQVDVFSRRLAARRAARRAPSARLRVREARTIDEMMRAYSMSDVVVVPLSPNAHASGVTVALEAMMLGRAVVVTNTGGLEEYLLHHAEYAEPSDPSSLADAIRRASARTPGQLDAARAHVLGSGLTLSDYVARHLELSRALIHGSGGCDGVGRREPVKPQALRRPLH